MTKEQPFSGTFKLDKETKNAVRYAEEAEGRRPVVGTVYVDKYELPWPFPKRIRMTVDPVEKGHRPFGRSGALVHFPYLNFLTWSGTPEDRAT